MGMLVGAIKNMYLFNKGLDPKKRVWRAHYYTNTLTNLLILLLSMSITKQYIDLFRSN